MNILNFRSSKKIKLLLILFVVSITNGCKLPESSSPSKILTANAKNTLVAASEQSKQDIQTTTPSVSTQTATPLSAATITLEPGASEIINTTPSLSQPVHLAVIGDYGAGGKAEGDVANLIKSWKVDYILTTGDNNYPVGASETIDLNIGKFYNEYIFPYTGEFGEGADENRFFPTLGNHDWDTDNAKPYLEFFTLPGNERYYDIVLGPVHVFAINSDWREPDGADESSTQAKWLRKQLAASTQPWKLIVFHAAAYSSGHHGSTKWMRWPYQEWGATAVLAAHDHLYERLDINGLPYFTNGLGGGAIYQFNDILPGSQVRYNSDYGAMLIIADEMQITFQFINRDGDLIDNYQITLDN